MRTVEIVLSTFRGKPFWKDENCPREQLQQSPAFKEMRRRRKWRPKTERPKKDLWRWMRWKVFQRDGWTCQYCQKTGKEVMLQVDHIIPVSRGGSNKLRNLVTACQKCNAKKCGDMLSKKQRRRLDRGLMARYFEQREIGNAQEREERERLSLFRDKMDADD